MMKSGAFANRDFRRYFVGQACSTFGDSAMFLALAIWAKQLTGSSSAAGAVFFAFTAPMMISAPFLGYLADRVHRRPLLIVTNLLSAAVLLPLLMVHGSSQLWIIYVVAVLMGFSTSLLGAGNAGILKDMVADEHLGGANAALRTARDGLRLVSPLVGAGLFAALGGGAVALVDGATFVVAAVAAVLLRVQESAPEPHDESLRESLTAGMRHIRVSPALFRLVTIAAVACLVIGFDETLVIAVVDKGLHQPPAFLGVLASIGGVGAILGGVTAVRAMRRLGEMGTAAAGLALFATGSLLETTGNLPVVLMAQVVLWVGVPWFVVSFMTCMQRQTPPRLQGRVSGAVDVAISGCQSVSIAVGAILATVVDYRLLLGVMALVVGACASALRRPLPPGPVDEAGEVSRTVEPAETAALHEFAAEPVATR